MQCVPKGRLTVLVCGKRKHPQMFPLKVLHDALQEAIAAGANITDEASAIERAGGQPLLVEGATRNFKVTHPADWELMELVLRTPH
jgi:2-C-methyl-D-erythritol 4-phosphate cytidylyltransferase